MKCYKTLTLLNQLSVTSNIKTKLLLLSLKISLTHIIHVHYHPKTQQVCLTVVCPIMNMLIAIRYR